MLSGRRSHEFDQLRTRIIVRKKVLNEYTAEEIQSMFPGLSQNCSGYLLKLVCSESLRTAKKLYDVALEFVAVQNEHLAINHLRNTQKQLLGRSPHEKGKRKTAPSVKVTARWRKTSISKKSRKA